MQHTKGACGVRAVPRIIQIFASIYQLLQMSLAGNAFGHGPVIGLTTEVTTASVANMK